MLNLSLSKLRVVNPKVTAKPESTGLTLKSQESMALAVEPSNPQQLSLFEWINGQVIGCSESATTPLVGTSAGECQ